MYEQVIEEEGTYVSESFRHQPSSKKQQKSKSLQDKSKKNDKKEKQFQNLNFEREVYEEPNFGNKLRNTCKNKYEEELLKIQLFNDALIRKEQSSNKKEFEKGKEQICISKQLILARIEENHRKKFPHFQLNKYLNDDASRGPKKLMEIREKEVSDHLSKKNNLQKQQEALIMSLSPVMRTKLGFKGANKNEANLQHEHTIENRVIEQDANRKPLKRQQNEVTSIEYSTLQLQSPPNIDNKQQTTMPTNLQKSNELSLEKKPWMILLEKRQGRAKSAFINTNKFRQLSDTNSNINKSIVIDALPFKEDFKTPQNLPNQNNAQLLNSTNLKWVSPIKSQGSQINKQTSIEYQSILPKEMSVLNFNEIGNLKKAKRYEEKSAPKPVMSKIDEAREKRKYSPLKFILTKYEGIVQEYYDKYKSEMRDIADLYLPAPTENPKTEENFSPQESYEKANIFAQNEQHQQQQQQQQQYGQQQQQQQYGQQLIKQLQLKRYQPNSTNNTFHFSTFDNSKLDQNMQSKYHKTVTAPAEILAPVSSRTLSTSNRFGRNKNKQIDLNDNFFETSRFLKRNKEICLRNQQLNKTLQEFQRESYDLKQITLDYQQITNLHDKRLSGIVPSQVEEQFSVLDFMRSNRREQDLKQQNIKIGNKQN